MKYTKEFWDRQPLGQKADWRLARELNVSVTTVSRQRRLRNIPPVGYGIDGKRIPQKKPIKIQKKDALIVTQKYITLQKVINTLENKIIDLRIAFYNDLPSYVGDSDIAEIIGCCEATVRKYRSIIDPNCTKNIIYEEKEVL
jgi:hypothetical protein